MEQHRVSNKLVDNMEKIAYKQDEFGMKKYGEPLSAAMNYDWLEMAFEEYADMGKYLQCEMDRKKSVLELLAIAVEDRSWDHVKFAIHELSKAGTGK